MIFGSKAKVTRKEHIGLWTVVEYNGRVNLYYSGAYAGAKTDKNFDEVVNEIKAFSH